MISCKIWVCLLYKKKDTRKKDCLNKNNKDKDEPTVNVPRNEDEQDSVLMASSP